LRGVSVRPVAHLVQRAIMLMAPERFRYVSGTPKTFTRSDLDRPVTREFCETCGDQAAGPASGDPEGRNP
jgi:hypothetical protein